jgi:hypothetical protein
MSAHIGATPYERSESRKGHRNGYNPGHSGQFCPTAAVAFSRYKRKLCFTCKCEGDRRGSNPRSSELQSLKPCFQALLHVAESA